MIKISITSVNHKATVCYSQKKKKKLHDPPLTVRLFDTSLTCSLAEVSDFFL